MKEDKKENDILYKFTNILGEMDLTEEELLNIKNHFLGIGGIIYEHYLARIGNRPEKKGDKMWNNE